VQEQILVGKALLKASLKSKDVGSKYQDGFITAGMGGGTGTGVRVAHN
jgi:cell division GTPase FtsZ